MAIESTENPQNSQIDPSSDPSNPYYVHPSDSQFRIANEKFNGSGFNDWKRSVIISLSSKNKLGFIDGSISKPTVNASLLKCWSRVNSTIIAWFIQALDTHIARSILYQHMKSGTIYKKDLDKQQEHKFFLCNSNLLIFNRE